MLVPKVQLIPSPEQVTGLLGETGALREGHFEFPTGLHSGHYFQIPLAMRYHGNARVLNVALSACCVASPKCLPRFPIARCGARSGRDPGSIRSSRGAQRRSDFLGRER